MIKLIRELRLKIDEDFIHGGYIPHATHDELIELSQELEKLHKVLYPLNSHVMYLRGYYSAKNQEKEGRLNGL